ncbi:MAG: acyltransferase [Nocardioidaceae bacterium]|nr:acyltransferase [Nocardioidaceae bacterium]
MRQPGDNSDAGAHDLRRRGLRADIEGLRAVAVCSVLLYHAGVAWTPGGFVGVDVFFVISGFLITILMLREVHHTGRLALVRFWARRARRLLPASALVLVFSAVVTLLWLPVTSRKEFGGDIVSAALYLVNWRLGYREVNYLAEDVGASPVQHFWSLAVEEQFYIVWPVLIALVIGLFRRRKALAPLMTVFVLSAASFVWTLHYSVAQPGLSFFVSTTRIWELGVGALVAAAYPRLARLPRWLRECLAWGGVGAIVFAVMEFDGTATWPGPATLVPVLGTGALLLAGPRGVAPTTASRLLGWRPAVGVGGLSYSLYLWHWPMLVAAKGIWGSGLPVRATVLVVIASVVPAWLSYRFVEAPIRYSRQLSSPRQVLSLGGMLTVTGVGVGVALIASFASITSIPVASEKEAPGAQAPGGARKDAVDWSTVDQVDALRAQPTDPDLPRIYDDPACVVDGSEDRYQTCEFGDKDSRHTVVLVGDSKAMQWFTPIERIAKDAGWRLVVIGKGGCEFADMVRIPSSTEQRNPSCDQWSQWSLKTVLGLRPDVVITVTRWTAALPEGGTTREDETGEAMVAGLVRHWQRVVGEGVTLVPILDTPGPPTPGPECILEHRNKLTACNYDLADRLPTTGAGVQLAAAAQVPQAHPIDMADVVCPGQGGTVCPPVIGNVRVYRTGTHLSDTFAETTWQTLSARLARATGGLLGQRRP